MSHSRPTRHSLRGRRHPDALDPTDNHLDYRIYPDVVSVKPLVDDERVSDDASPLVAEWRERRALLRARRPQVEGFEAAVWMLERDLCLIDEGRLTLPPGRASWGSGNASRSWYDAGSGWIRRAARSGGPASDGRSTGF